MSDCRHCGQPVPVSSAGGADFCCRGCQAAYGLINGLGLDRYYQRRSIDPEARPLRPDEDDRVIDYGSQVTDEGDGIQALHLMVEGIHCAACVWLIEAVLARQPGVRHARVNMTTRRLVVRWAAAETDADKLLAPVTALGYRLVPYDPQVMSAEGQARDKELLRAMVVAGFAAANVMLLSVSVWAGYSQGMDQVTRDLMHWISALIALPAVAYAGVPFFRSAITALRAGRLNMDVPISLAIVLASGMSLFETIRSGEHAYFDSAITLLFFLLIGRYLDSRARGRARATAERLVGLGASAVEVLMPSGERRYLPTSKVEAGMTVLAATGDRIAVDGEVIDGRSDLDTSLLTGETVPQPVAPGGRVFAGTLNLSAPLRIKVLAVGEGTLLAEIVRLMEAAEQGRAHHVAVADRVARWYAPVVHGLSLITFLGWWLGLGADWQVALLNAIAVLIITCPCALALAVPVVQVIASGRLMRQGILIKTGTALERLVEVDHVVFDKTGTLTLGRPELIDRDAIAPEDLDLAVRLAGASRHPLARALVRAVPHRPVQDGVAEEPGRGLYWDGPDGRLRLGSRAWCGADVAATDGPPGPELWLDRPGRAPVRISFSDSLRADSASVVGALKALGLGVSLLSGDRAPVAQAVAAELGIDDWQGGLAPADKVARLQALAQDGKRVLMVGDGLNDAPALAAAHVSVSPSSAVDVSQTVADAIFQGDKLAPILELLEVARRSDRLVKQNFAIAFLYNGVTIPMAIAGLITPLLASIAMSSSSLIVIGNALRLSAKRKAG